MQQIARVPASAADLPLMSDYYGASSRARVFGYLSIAGLVGGLISGPLIGWLVQIWTWRVATMVLGALSLVVACLVFLLKEPARGAADRVDLGMDAELARIAPAPPTLLEALRGAWSIRTLRLQAIAGFVQGFSSPLMVLLMLIMAQKFALGPFERGLISTIGIVLTFPTLLIGTAVADRLLARKPSTLVVLQAGAQFLTSVALVLQAFSPNLVVFVILGVIPSIVSALLGPVGAVVQAMILPARYRGVGMQVYTPFSLIGAVLAPVLLAVSAQINLQMAFLFFAPFLVISGLLYLASANSVSRDIRAARATAAAEEIALSAALEQSDKALVVQDLEVAYGEHVALASVSFSVPTATITAVCGPNGAGKTSLLRAVAGHQQANNGAVFVLGRDATHLSASELTDVGVTFVPGGEGVFGHLSVRANLELAVAGGRRSLQRRRKILREDHKAYRRFLAQQEKLQAEAGPGEVVSATMLPPADSVTDHRFTVDEVLAAFPSIAERLDDRAATLSGGEQQMVSLGQAMLMGPDVLLIDELTMGLSTAVIDRLLASLVSIRDQGTTVVLVEQSLETANRVADHLLFLHEGRIRYEGDPRGIYDHPELVRAAVRGSTARRPAADRGCGAGSPPPCCRRATSWCRRGSGACSTASASTCRLARSSRLSGPTVPARPPSSTPCPATRPWRAVPWNCSARTSLPRPRSSAPGAGWRAPSSGRSCSVA